MYNLDNGEKIDEIFFDYIEFHLNCLKNKKNTISFIKIILIKEINNKTTSDITKLTYYVITIMLLTSSFIFLCFSFSFSLYLVNDK